jgi:hypothetical protein
MEDVAARAVLLLRRFDRLNQRRIPFLSAMSLLDAEDNEQRSYLEIADALRRYGAKPEEDRDSSTAATPPDDVLGSDSIRFWSANDAQAQLRLQPNSP